MTDNEIDAALARGKVRVEDISFAPVFVVQAGHTEMFFGEAKSEARRLMKFIALAILNAEAVKDGA